MKNSKNYILATIGGAVLFSLSFAIGAHTDRVQTPADNTRNFAYPKLDESVPVEQQAATAKQIQKERKRSGSTSGITAVAPQHHRVTPARKKRVRITEPTVTIPVPPANKTPVDEDNNEDRIPGIIEDKIADSSDKIDRSAEEQHSKAEEKAATKEVPGKTPPKEPEDSVVTKGSPKISGKEVTPVEEVPKEVKPEPAVLPESSN
jgi:hypothetical protein